MDVGTGPSLEPLTMAQILDRAFRLYRRRFLTFVGIIAVALVPLMLIQLVFDVVNIPEVVAIRDRINQSPDGVFPDLSEELDWWSARLGGARTVVFSVLQFILVQGIATAALARAVGDNYLGRPTDIPGAYGRIRLIWLRLLGMIALAVLVLVGLIVFLILPCVGWLIGPGVLIYFGGVIYPLLPPVLVLEGQMATGVFRRVWDLVRRRFWWSLGFMLVLQIFRWITVSVPKFVLSLGLTIGLLRMSYADPAMAMTIQAVIQSLVTLFLNMLFLPLQMTAITLMYFDLRVRTEGLDLALLAARSGGESGVEVAAQAPRPERGNLITGNEVFHFFGVGAALLAVCGLCYGAMILLVLVP